MRRGKESAPGPPRAPCAASAAFPCSRALFITSAANYREQRAQQKEATAPRSACTRHHPAARMPSALRLRPPTPALFLWYLPCLGQNLPKSPRHHGAELFSCCKQRHGAHGVFYQVGWHLTQQGAKWEGAATSIISLGISPLEESCRDGAAGRGFAPHPGTGPPSPPSSRAIPPCWLLPRGLRALGYLKSERIKY